MLGAPDCVSRRSVHFHPPSPGGFIVLLNNGKLVVSSPNPSSDSRRFILKKKIINHNLIWETLWLKLALNHDYFSINYGYVKIISTQKDHLYTCKPRVILFWWTALMVLLLFSIERQKKHYYHHPSSFQRTVTKHNSLNIDLMHQIT